MPYRGRYSDLSHKNNRLNRFNFIKNSKKGAILIEFAFAVPVLFSLIYYIQDLATIKRWHSKLDFSLHCAANMFQNTPNITKSDFARICYASVIGMFGDPEHNIRPEGYTEWPIISCALSVRGTGNNNCTVNWFAYSDVSATGNDCKTANSIVSCSSKFAASSPKAGNVYSATQLDPSLVINEGETKIILEISVYKGWCNKDYSRDYFKLFIAKLPNAIACGHGHPSLMNHSIIFTPKPGTFDPNKPPQ